jgi:hypothetical protein
MSFKKKKIKRWTIRSKSQTLNFRRGESHMEYDQSKKYAGERSKVGEREKD